ncbi:hypothetical protein P4E94_10280 [Pontiellaceae bacterium B12219]|nr:hypothetical protein [Pontiellaceae bacterium B12219]
MKIQLAVLLLLAAGTAMAQRGREENQQTSGAAGFISKLDKDKDGQISETEFDGPAEHFSQFDKNGDGYISESEAPTGPPQEEQGKNQSEERGLQQKQRPQRGQDPADEGGFVARLDKDKDGKVSADEFDGPSEHFSQLDKNNDGYLGEDEAPSGPPPRGRR